MRKTVSPTRSLLATASLTILGGFMVASTAAPKAEGFRPFAALPDFGAAVHYPQLAGDPLLPHQYNRAIATGDFNGDGFADLVVGQTSGVKVAFGNGSGGMSTAITAGGTEPTPNDIAVADLDNDGDPDIVTSNHGGGGGTTFSVLFNNGGTFGAVTTYTVPAGYRSLKVTTGELNGDQTPEVVVLSDKLVMVWNNNGSGGLTLGFTRPYWSPNCCTHSSYSAVRVAKINADAHADLVLTINTYDSGNEPPLQIMPGLGNGSFGPTSYHKYPLINGRPPYHTNEVEVADVDGDGALDVIAGAQRIGPYGNSHLVVMRNDGSGAFPPADASVHGLEYIYGGPVLAGDLNDDGHVDLVGTLSNGASGYFLNDGAGNFPYAGVSTVQPGGVQSAVLADLNGSGNGSMDLVLVRDKAVFSLLNGTVVDSTPPAITPTVNGASSGGWYTSDVTVSWTVSDAESAASSSGCETQTITTDTTSTTITCSATSLGGTSSQSVTIRRDTAGPSIASASATPSMLWPPNNKMRAVAVSVDASDAGAGLASCAITGVTDSEGTSQHEPDAEITGALTLNLRAERRGNGSGRSYGVQIACTDAAGNTSSAVATVGVPHDQGKGK